MLRIKKNETIAYTLEEINEKFGIPTQNTPQTLIEPLRQAFLFTMGELCLFLSSVVIGFNQYLSSIGSSMLTIDFISLILKCNTAANMRLF